MYNLPIMKDSFGREVFAKKIVEEIVSKYKDELKRKKNDPEHERENIIFAISGKWGEGKTFLLKRIRSIAIEKGFTPIWFDPWKYTQEEVAIKRAFLKELNNSLCSNCDLSNLYSDKSETIINKNKLLKYLILFYIVFLLFPQIIQINSTLNSFLQLLMPLGIVSLFISTFSINKKSSAISTSEEFEEKFNTIIKNKKKILCLIDNLDRCEPSSVKKILDSLKTFMCNEECSYIITGDHTVIEKYVGRNLHIKGSKSNNEVREGRRFIKKLFDVYWRLPIPTARQSKIFIEDNLKKSKIIFNSDESKNNLISMLDDDDLFERNPRHILRFITKLRFTLDIIKIQLDQLDKKSDDLAIKDLEDIINNPDLLAKVLLIEEFFYELYSYFTLHPEKYILTEKNIKKSTSIEDIEFIDEKINKIISADKTGEFINLVKFKPLFTDDKGTVIHEVNTFFTFSGSTGLPGNTGPDENNFIEWLKNGQLIDELSEIIKNATSKEKNISFAKKAIETLGKSSDQEQLNIINQSLELCNVSNEWLDNIDKWIDIWSTKYLENGEVYQKLIKPVIKKNEGSLIENIYTKNINLFNEHFWSKYNDEPKTKEINSILSKILKDICNSEEKDIIFLQKYFEYNDDCKTELDKIIKNREDCKSLILKCDTPDLLNSKFCGYIFEKLTSFLDTIDCVDWIIENKALFDIKQSILKGIVINILEKANNKKDFIHLLAVKDILNQDNSYENLIEKINKNIKDSDDLSLLTVDELTSKLNKGEKLKIIENIVTNFFKEKNKKQKETLVILTKTSNFFKDSGINTEDMKPRISKIKRAKKGFGITDPNITELRKLMRNSWDL